MAWSAAPIGASLAGARAPLCEPVRHAPLAALEWDADLAAQAIAAIADDARAAFDGERLFEAHPLDTEGETIAPYANLYFGAAGVLVALDLLASSGAIAEGPPYASVLPALLERSRLLIEARRERACGYLMGELGVLLAEWRLTRDPALLEPIAAHCADSVEYEARELTWGAPGAMLAALFLHRASGDARWARLYRACSDRLLADLRFTEAGIAVWNQRLFGLSFHILGAGHGLAGCALPLVRGRALLGEPSFTHLIDRITATLSETAFETETFANWPKMVEPYPPIDVGADRCLLQWCHGAPGVVTSLAEVPLGASPRLDELLRKAGELTYAAGPLAKGAGLCHGTAGNGYALLKLYERTREPVWLERARRFAMHAIEQVAAARRETGPRHSLFTGDIGVACFLFDCIRARAEIPCLDALV